MNNFVVFFTTLLSSGVLATVISISLTEAKEQRLLRRSKIEEIYLNGSAWLNTANARFLPYLRVSEGDLTYNEALDLEIKNADKVTGEQRLKLNMNIEMYERSLIPALRLVDQELKKLNYVHSELRNRYAQTGEASEFLTPLKTQLLAFGKAGDALLEAVVLRGAEIGAERGLLARAYEWTTHHVSLLLRNRSGKP